MENSSRLDDHKKNPALEDILREMESILSEPESRLLNDFHSPSRPIVLIVGCARSGTTLLFQYLAASGMFSYPTNLISRFYYAPYIGARIQQLLIDHDLKGEIFGKNAPNSFRSELGKTFGPLQPHEFWYFWDRFFQFGEIQTLSDEQLTGVNASLFLKELAALQEALQKPLVMKAMKLNWHLPYLAGLSEQVYFVYIKRDVLFNAQSLLEARMKFFGTYEKWYSFKPPQYASMAKKPYYEQVIDQVIETNAAIEEGLKTLPKERFIKIHYTDFCNNPLRVLQQVQLMIGENNEHTELPPSFTLQEKARISDLIWTKMQTYHTSL